MRFYWSCLLAICLGAVPVSVWPADLPAVKGSRVVFIYPSRVKIPENTAATQAIRTVTIHLAAYNSRPAPQQLPDVAVYKDHPVYLLQVSDGKKTFYWLRLGFFKNSQQAERYLIAVKQGFPQAQLAEAGVDEKYLSRRWMDVYTETEPPSAPAPIATTMPAPAITKVALNYDKAREQDVLDQMLALMEQARQAIAGNDYSRAVLLYTAVLQSPAVSLHEQALELLGLARERNGQMAHAKAEYDAFLQRYPDSPAAERIRQRLAGITTARDAPKEKLRSTSRSTQAALNQFYGSFAQHYRVDSNLSDSSARDQGYLSTDAELDSRYRNANIEVQSRVSGTYQMATADERDDHSRLYYAYVDSSARSGRFAVRLGRQSRASGGVLGRFDGAWLSFGLAPVLKMNFATGFPANTSAGGDSFQTDQIFQSVSLDIGTLAKRWDFTAFYVTQQSQGVDERQATGGEARYYTAGQSYFSLLDYDLIFGEVNTAMLLGNWQITQSSNINMALDYRRSPALTMSNALQGQTATDLESLGQTYSLTQIQDLALDRSPIYRSINVSAQQSLTQRLSVNADVTATNLSGTPESGGVPATDPTGQEFYYGLRLLASRVFATRDLYMAGIRYADRANRDVWTLLLNARLRIGSAWRINPNLRFDKQNRTDGKHVSSLQPGLQLSYQMRKNFAFELESGYLQSDESAAITGEDQKSLFVYAGYRWDFE